MRRDLKGANSDAYFYRWQVALVYEPGEEEEPLRYVLMTDVKVVRITAG